MNAPYPTLDPSVTGEFVRACNRAIAEARKLESIWREEGDLSKADLAASAADYIAGRRDHAVQGTLPAPSSDLQLGISRFVSDYSWGPFGDAFSDAAHEAERIWYELE